LLEAAEVELGKEGEAGEEGLDAAVTDVPAPREVQPQEVRAV